MKRWLQKLKDLFGILYKVLPFFIGMYCYYPAFTAREGSIYPFWDAVYASLKLYGGSTEAGVPVGTLLQLARFMALAATFSILIKVFNKMGDLFNWLKLRGRGAVVVYGDSDYAAYLYESLPPGQRILGREKLIRNASRYALLYQDEADSLAFYDQYYEMLKDKNVYMLLSGIDRQNIENPRLTVFNIAEDCARQYWKKYPAEKSERIAVIGFGSIGRNILLYGLQLNIIDPGQSFEYHIYGDGREFRREHTKLDRMQPDKIIFHDDGCFSYEELAGFDRVIICGGEKGNDSLTVLSRLLAAVSVRGKIYVCAPNGGIVASLFGKERVVCFGTAEELGSVENILNEGSMRAARNQHEFYVKQYGGVPWEKLDAFKRYSNVSSSDYLDVIRKLMARGIPMATLAELEHIRWCRYHYLHNWDYGPERDDGRRIHNSLIPFAKLSEEEKQKDVEAIKSKLEG